MKVVRHTVSCDFEGCKASLCLEVVDTHEMRSVGQMLYDVAQLAGWDMPSGDQRDERCPVHRAPGAHNRRCTCELRNGIKHGEACELVKAGAASPRRQP